MCQWNTLSPFCLPPIKDRWYLFGGYDDNGIWTFDKWHYSLNGFINGYNIERVLQLGVTHWATVKGPKL